MGNIASISVAATGKRDTTTINTSTGGTIPVTSAGSLPKYVIFTATGTAYLRLGVGAQTALTTDKMVQPGAPVTMAVHGNSHYAVIDDGVSVKVNTCPLEDL